MNKLWKYIRYAMAVLLAVSGAVGLVLTIKTPDGVVLEGGRDG